MVHLINKFEETPINPVTEQRYDENWIVICLTDDPQYEAICGTRNNCAYTLKISRTADPNWRMHAGDFLDFHNQNGKQILACMTKEDLHAIQAAYAGHSYSESTLRSYEPGVMVHSTPAQSWLSIQQDGCLKSWNRLKKEKTSFEAEPIGRKLGDPAEFSDYIMFSTGHVSGEIVVQSHQAGRLMMDVNTSYCTGARLYFDLRKIARDGLLVRDGQHLKVKDVLPLEPYLLWKADWKNAGLDSEISTPYKFCEASNLRFNELFSVGGFCV